MRWAGTWHELEPQHPSRCPLEHSKAQLSGASAPAGPSPARGRGRQAHVGTAAPGLPQGSTSVRLGTAAALGPSTPALEGPPFLARSQYLQGGPGIAREPGDSALAPQLGPALMVAHGSCQLLTTQAPSLPHTPHPSLSPLCQQTHPSLLPTVSTSRGPQG